MTRLIHPHLHTDWLVYVHSQYTHTTNISPFHVHPIGEPLRGPTIYRIMDVPLDTPFWEVGHLTASFEANPPTFFIPWNILTNGELTSQELTLQEAVIYLNSTQPAIKWAVRTGLLPSFRPRKNQGGHRGHHFSKFDLDWYKDNIYCSPGKSKKIQIADENGNITETNLNF